MRYQRRKPLKPFDERFWPRINKTDTCWLWTGCTRQGYGVVTYNGKQTDTHRVMWEITHGPIPDGMWVLHRCDVRNCINPDHLFLGTVADNNRDMYRKGRNGNTGARGEASGRAKLTNDDVREIRSLWRAGGLSQEAIGKRFGVNQRSVSNIVLGKSWSHVT